MNKERIDYLLKAYQEQTITFQEKTEYIKFGMANLNNIIVKSDTLKITLLDDDFPIYKIGKVNKQTNTAKTSDSLNVKCRIYGTIYGVNIG